MTFNSNSNSNNNLQTTEPAFLSHEKYVRQRPRGYHKNLTYFCYSLSNLALIVACVLALIFSVKFLQDDPLYEYGEYLLTLKFYRYIIYIIVILPLTLLVPLFNAASACFLSGSGKRGEPSNSVLGVKMFYQVLMAILILIGLIFIAPNIRQSSVTNQMEIEFRRHMKWRYDNEFSYEFLDRMQDEYECCDELWYRANYGDKLPLSCFTPDGTYSNIHRQSCPEVLGSLVSTRCVIIAASLIVIILSLAILIGMDLNELMGSSGSRHYDIRERETNIMKQEPEETTSLQQTSRRNSRDELDRNEEHDQLVEELSNRLRMREREREVPLLSKTLDTTTKTSSPTGTTTTTSLVSNHQRSSSFSDDEDDKLEVQNCRSTSNREGGHIGQAILTRANYRQYNNRPKSPVFLRTPDSGSGSMNDQPGPGINQSSSRPSNYYTNQPQTSNNNYNNNNSGGTSPKSVLKKTSSFQRIDSDDLEDVDEDDLNQKQVQRDAQTRRSLLNVRFAE